MNAAAAHAVVDLLDTHRELHAAVHLGGGGDVIIAVHGRTDADVRTQVDAAILLLDDATTAHPYRVHGQAYYGGRGHHGGAPVLVRGLLYATAVAL